MSSTNSHKSCAQFGTFRNDKDKTNVKEKYWFPELNKMTERIVGQCYECQLTTKQHRQEPVKMSKIPEKPWEVVSGGPYPDGRYNLVVIDKRTRYPEAERVYSTSAKSTTEKLKKMFATHGTPIRLESDNGPPFTSREFSEFAEVEGFQHHRVTPMHPRSNGEAENFMKLLNKTEQRARIQKISSTIALQEMLTSYRSAPHPATGITSYEGMMNRLVRTKLDYKGRLTEQFSKRETQVNERDRQYKERVKQNAENKNTKEHNFKVGDLVLLRQQKENKWSTFYEPDIYIVYKIEGSTIIATRIRDGKEPRRDSTHFKITDAQTFEANAGKDTLEKPHGWRENILRKSKTPKNTDMTESQAGQMIIEEQENVVEDNTDEPATTEAVGNEGFQPRRSERTKTLRRFCVWISATIKMTGKSLKHPLLKQE